LSVKRLIRGLLNSYSVIFFSDKILFALILLAITFFDPFSGLCGIISLGIANLTADLLGFDRSKIEKGYYGFNSLLLGIGVSIGLETNWIVLLIVILGSVLCLFITIGLENILNKYFLPYLSIPFLFSFWLLSLALRDINFVQLANKDIYFFNYLYGLGGQDLLDKYLWWRSFEFAETIRTYFISLGSIVFFPHKIVSGILISIGLLYYSRISFSLSLIGFYTAFYFFKLIGFHVPELVFSYIGFNFILTAIAIGGYFMIPSASSYLWAIIVTPITAIIFMASNKLFSVWGLIVYSLPFNITVLLFLTMIKSRFYKSEKLTEVNVQSNSPETNLYNFVNNNHRYKDHVYFSIRLPFYGVWVVSQGHDGEITHKDKWRHAWDFVIRDNENKTYGSYGTSAENYYCYGKAILSPADGYVEDIVDGIPDNSIGDVNTDSNWGNTIIIRHGDGLYSQMSHLKPYSFKVKKGDRVRSGQAVAGCGNSGRSPEPHLHFQFQTIPVIGAETVDYPLGYYLLKNSGTPELKSFERPAFGDNVSNLEVNSIMKNAFHFIPGQKISFDVTDKGKKKRTDWEVITDIYNVSYIYCRNSDSCAYFANDDRVFYFYNFTGDKKSLLYYFFLSAYKMPLGFYEGVEVKDTVAINHVYTKSELFFQDFIAPFYVFLGADYDLKYTYRDEEINSSRLEIVSGVTKSLFGQKTKISDFHISLTKNGIKKIIIKLKNKSITAECLEK
jgi:urea transporter/murein DD-endopeptidase MepM/ murein hydrolase activator NlpD